MTDAGSRMEVLLFRVGGVPMGVDTAQVAHMLAVGAPAGDRAGCVRFDEIVDFGGRAVSYMAPRALAIRDGMKQPLVVVDEPADFVWVPIGDIRPLPAAIRASGRARAFWGAFIWRRKIVLLVDFYRIFGPGPA